MEKNKQVGVLYGFVIVKYLVKTIPPGIEYYATSVSDMSHLIQRFLNSCFFQIVWKEQQTLETFHTTGCYLG